MNVRTADGKGRLTLGSEFANKTFLVELVDGEFRLTPATVVPEREAWLYQNSNALESLRRGLNQARRGEFAARAPDVASDLVDEIKPPRRARPSKPKAGK